MYKNGLIRKIRLILKFMTPQPGLQTIAIAQYLKKLRQPGTKFGQLIGHNMSNNSVEKSYTKCAEETFPRPLSKKSKMSMSLD